MCRKVAEVKDGGTVEMWGDGSAIRSYTHVDDMVDGIFRLMHSDLEGAANIGCPQYVSVNELLETVAKVAGKNVLIRHIEGPVGVQSRNFSNDRIYSIGWKPRVYLEEGIRRTYPWIEKQVLFTTNNTNNTNAGMPG
jgi:GDP-D-mannose 3',5'-epimerase